MSSRRKSTKRDSRPPSFEHEDAARKAGYAMVAGADEAGRGCLAGPVVAAAVLLPPGRRIRGVRDSKLLNRVQRERLAEEIESCAISTGYGVCSVEEIDRLNILRASLEAMRRALAALDPEPDFALIDGNQSIHPLPFPHQTVIDGDTLCHAIAAASVLAKVRRDEMMRALNNQYPGYGLAQHKGYATKGHVAAIEALGPAPCHRKSFRRPGANGNQPGLFADA